MDFLNSINGFLGSGTPLGNLANSTLTGLVNGNPKPAPIVSAPAPAPVVTVQTRPMNYKLIFGVVGGVIIALTAGFLIFKKR